jgi:hypothetical protein
MAGAVSAGAYTAGVLDFLIEALDTWYDAKNSGAAVPMHEISLDVFSGASAGGMCAAIASAMVQGEFDHIHDTSLVGTTNRFYESWVNKIDIRELLKTDDLPGPVYSLLDCNIIDQIADFAILPGTPKSRAYISPSLTLFLTLTNLTGTPYALNDEGGSAEESTLYHADWLRFETVLPGGTPTTPLAKPLPLQRPDQGAWTLLKEAAKATGAFPIFLKPRQLTRDRADYDRPLWESINLAAPHGALVKPSWPAATGETIQTVNVDGGVIDNDPFDLAHDYLASLPPGLDKPNQNPRDPKQADRAVVTVSPFPAQAAFDTNATLAKDGPVAIALGNLVSVFIGQSRFFGESLALITEGTSSRFVIAPSDDRIPSGSPALECASLGAFGGFFERNFRAHDFQLGRRNCQQFLRRHFALPADNPIFNGRLSDEARTKFKIPAPPDAPPMQNQDWIPIIPLCSAALNQDEPWPQPGKISQASLTQIVKLIDGRLNAVLPQLLRDAPAAVRIPMDGLAKLVELLGKDKMKEFLAAQMGDSVEQG